MRNFFCKALRAASIFLIGVFIMPTSIFIFIIQALWKIVDYTFERSSQ